MPTNQKYHKNYTEFGEPYQLVLPLNLEGLVPDDDSARLLSHELEEVDYSLLHQAYSAKGRNPVVDPKTMFKIHTFVWKKSVGEWKAKIFQKVQETVSLLNQEYLQSFSVTEETKTQDLQKICQFLERQTIYDWHTTSFQGRNNYCKTDPDATFMHMKDNHMRNAQLKPGYNVQIAVDSEYIVATDVFQDRNDVWALVPFLKGDGEKPAVPVSQYHGGFRI